MKSVLLKEQSTPSKIVSSYAKLSNNVILDNSFIFSDKLQRL